MGRRVVIVGGGATGTAAFLALVRHRAAASVDIVDPLPPGRGTVFDTTSPTLLCNTSAGVMSLVADRPDDFVHYLQRRGLPVGPSDFVPRQLVSHYCMDSYRSHTGRARHVPARALAISRQGSAYRVRLDDGTELPADDVVVCHGTGPPVVPALLRRHIGRPGLFPTVYPEGLLLAGLRPGSRVLVLGTRLSAIDATLLLCRHGHRVTLASRSGQLPAVRTRIHRTGRAPLDHAAFARLDLTDPALPLRVLSLVSRATGPRSLADQVSVSDDPVHRLRHEIALASMDHTDWQDVIAELIDLINDRLSTVDRTVRRMAMSSCQQLIARYISAFPLQNARRLLGELDNGAATLAPPAPIRIEPNRGEWVAEWPGEAKTRFDAVVCATGYRPPPLSCRNNVLRLDTSTPPLPELDADLRLRFPGAPTPERIWLLGTASYLRTPIVNYLRTAVTQADLIARSMVNLDQPARRAA